MELEKWEGGIDKAWVHGKGTSWNGFSWLPTPHGEASVSRGVGGAEQDTRTIPWYPWPLPHPIFWVSDSQWSISVCPLPKGHLEDLALVHMLGPVVVTMQHLSKEGVVEFRVRFEALGALADIWEHQAGFSIRSQLVLLHTTAWENRPES